MSPFPLLLCGVLVTGSLCPSNASRPTRGVGLLPQPPARIWKVVLGMWPYKHGLFSSSVPGLCGGSMWTPSAFLELGGCVWWHC